MRSVSLLGGVRQTALLKAVLLKAVLGVASLAAVSAPAFADDVKAPESSDAKPADVKAPEAKPEAKAEAKADAKADAPKAPVTPWCPKNAPLCFKSDHFSIAPRVTLRAGYDYIQPDAQVLFVGQNDGFFLDEVRVGVDVGFDDVLRARINLDATSILPGTPPNSAVRPVSAAAADAYVAWTPSPWFHLSVGQQQMPIDAEGQARTAELPFSRRSVATEGVRAGEGIAVAGLSPDRQVGLVIGSDDAGMGDLKLDWQLAASNGNGLNFLGNDNKLPAAYARIGVGYTDMVSFHVGGRFNPRTVGTLPNQFVETDSVGFADVTLNAGGFAVVAQGIVKATQFNTLVPDPSNKLGTDLGFGGTAWIVAKKPFGMDLAGVEPAYRISYYDPSSAFADDQLLENSIGLRWNVPGGLPLSLFADYTFLTEVGTGVRDLQDDRFTAMLQLAL